jgi:hypothetical protein
MSPRLLFLLTSLRAGRVLPSARDGVDARHAAGRLAGPGHGA